MPKVLTVRYQIDNSISYVFVQESDGVASYSYDSELANSAATDLDRNSNTDISEVHRRYSGGYSSTKVEELDDTELAELVDGMHKGTPKK